MKSLYKTIAIAAASAAIGLGIGYKIGDRFGYERAPADMPPAEYIQKRFSSLEQKARESTPKTDRELIEWFRNFKTKERGR